MPIPDYQTLMLPLLKIAGDGAVHSKRDVVPELAVQFRLSEEEQKELLPSGKQEIFNNRVGWARTYLKKALLIDYVQRGQFRITDRGKQVLAENPAREYANGLEMKVILIDGPQLAELMFDFDVGISTESTYVVKGIDNDFFEDDTGVEVVARQ